MYVAITEDYYGSPHKIFKTLQDAIEYMEEIGSELPPLHSIIVGAPKGKYLLVTEEKYAGFNVFTKHFFDSESDALDHADERDVDGFAVLVE